MRRRDGAGKVVVVTPPTYARHAQLNIGAFR
jgi:hypothetical protein